MPAVEPLITALNDESIRGNVAAALGKIRDSRALEPLIALLKDKEKGVRGLVAGALGEIGDTRAVEPLIALFRWDSDNRANVAAALGEIGDARAVELLIPMLRGDTPINAEIEAEALGKIGDIRAVDPLIEVLRQSMNVPRERRVEVMDGFALELFDPQTKNVLSSMIDNMASAAISAAAKALGDIGDSKAMGPLEELSQNVSDKDIQQAAKEALRKLRGR